ncbi:MAG: DNA-directed RNA polymerase subunit H [Candidatus Aenigmatarchaeota archaeon]
MAKAREEEKAYDILKHSLVPRHEVMTADEVKELLIKHNITTAQLPRILITDAAVKAIGAKEGDVLRITRSSPTAGTTTYYRIVQKE